MVQSSHMLEGFSCLDTMVNRLLYNQRETASVSSTTLLGGEKTGKKKIMGWLLPLCLNPPVEANEQKKSLLRVCGVGW